MRCVASQKRQAITHKGAPTLTLLRAVIQQHRSQINCFTRILVLVASVKPELILFKHINNRRGL